jgi:hypothetical protein
VAKITDKITTTFYDEDEVAIANRFRTILMKRNRSLNQVLKELILQFVKDNE